MNTELFLYLCKQVGLDIHEMDEYLTIGACIDYIEEYIENNKKEEKPSKGRKATQEDFANF